MARFSIFFSLKDINGDQSFFLLSIIISVAAGLTHATSLLCFYFPSFEYKKGAECSLCPLPIVCRTIVIEIPSDTVPALLAAGQFSVPFPLVTDLLWIVGSGVVCRFPPIARYLCSSLSAADRSDIACQQNRKSMSTPRGICPCKIARLAP